MILYTQQIMNSSIWGCHSHDRMVIGFTITYIYSIQSVPITTNTVSLIPYHGEVYSIQHYVIKFVSDLRQVGVLKFPIPIKQTVMI